MTHYIHNLNPVLLPIAGPLAIRWYGLAYLLGFIASILLLRRWSKQGSFSVPTKEVSNFIVGLALFGVFIGGRLGYMLFYAFDTFIADPLSILRPWEGGMASHGGFIGTILFMMWYAKKHGHTFWNLADHMAATTSLGLLFGRLANFINGELWGRISTVKWAMIFPQELGLPYGTPHAEIEALVQSGALQPRHPSQLYQAACEGLLVFILMLTIRRTTWGKRPGALCGSYLALYALARIAMEFFREPDSTIYLGWLTKGQLLSALMLLGTAFIFWKNNLFKNQPASNA